jgi:hypothetical protein
MTGLGMMIAVQTHGLNVCGGDNALGAVLLLRLALDLDLPPAKTGWSDYGQETHRKAAMYSESTLSFK